MPRGRGRMNTRRLSTNIPFILSDNIESRLKILLNAPSNYKIHTDGKIYIISEKKFLRSRGNLEIELYSDKGIYIKSFNSNPPWPQWGHGDLNYSPPKYK